MTRRFMLCTHHQTSYSGYEIKKNEIGEASGTHGRQDSIQGFGGETSWKT
jgi:hypothetical protein